MALNDNSPRLQGSRNMNQLHGFTAACIKYQWVQAGAGHLLSSQNKFQQMVQTGTSEVPIA